MLTEPLGFTLSVHVAQCQTTGHNHTTCSSKVAVLSARHLSPSLKPPWFPKLWLGDTAVIGVSLAKCICTKWKALAHVPGMHQLPAQPLHAKSRVQACWLLAEAVLESSGPKLHVQDVQDNLCSHASMLCIKPPFFAGLTARRLTAALAAAWT